MIVGEAPAGCEKPASGALVAVLAAGILLGSLWGGSSSVQAATCVGEACDYGDYGSGCPLDLKAGGELAEFDIHPVANTAEPPETPALDASGTESMAPFLYLTPRVATILDEVFGDEDTAMVEAADEAAEPAVAAGQQTEVALPPVAGTESRANTAPFGPLALPDNANSLPKFQRQMYRTDI